MTSHQPNVWHTRSKQHQHQHQHQQPASRTPQNRSTIASPSPAQQHSQANPPSSKSVQQQPQTSNVWAQRASNNNNHSQSRVPSNGRSTQASASSASTAAAPATGGFNAAEVRAFLARDLKSSAYATYRADQAQGEAKSGAWVAGKTNTNNDNKSFFDQLAKQVATLEGGG